MEKPKKKWNPKFKSTSKCANRNSSTSRSNARKRPFPKLYEDWNLYLQNEDYDENGHMIEKLLIIKEYLSQTLISALVTIATKRHFRVNINDVLKNERFISHWPDIMHDLVNCPETIIGLFGLAMEYLIRENDVRSEEECPIMCRNEELVLMKKVKLNPRFIGFQNFLHFQELKSDYYGKFVTLIGTVVRVSDIKPFCTYLAFTCLKCNTVQITFQVKGCYTLPNRCTGKDCFCTKFKPSLDSPLTQTIPIKNISLQELNMDQNEGGRVPRTLECELTYDLTDSCMPGDIVIISGIIVINSACEKKLVLGKDSCAHILQMTANSVICLKGKNIDNINISSGGLEFGPEDLSSINHIHSEKDLFRLIVASLCPNIYGHEYIKAGLILGLFGGRDRSHVKEKTAEFSIRENSHVLIVGDPGLGKSQLLLACANVSPRGVYVCGNSTTASGLTATIIKDAGGENSLEAGALVLADQGHCCIDEFDKMINQHSALLEAMEQQTISMAKSGVVCALPARTSIIAAANPSGGHYNKAKTVSENLKIKGALLSRFDLVFIVKDKPDKDLDSEMSKHVMAFHTDSCYPLHDCSSNGFVNFIEEDTLCTKNILLRRLQIKPNENLNLISSDMLRKFISYARKFSQPKLTPEVSKILQSFYLDMRKQNKLNFSTPITTRQLESLIRLTQARARVELRAFCTIYDAEEVVEIMKYSMRDTYSDDLGNIDFDRSIHGSGMSNRAQAKKLINSLTRAAGIKGDDCFTTREMRELAKKSKIAMLLFDDIIETLNNEGFLLKKGHQFYQIQTI